MEPNAIKPPDARLIAAAPELLEACKMVLLFHDAGPWTEEKSWQWFNMSQSPVATTKAMCDRIREVIARAEGTIGEGTEGQGAAGAIPAPINS